MSSTMRAQMDAFKARVDVFRARSAALSAGAKAEDRIRRMVNAGCYFTGGTLLISLVGIMNWHILFGVLGGTFAAKFIGNVIVTRWAKRHIAEILAANPMPDEGGSR